MHRKMHEEMMLFLNKKNTKMSNLSTLLEIKNFLRSRDLSLDLRIRMVRCYVYPVFRHEMEAWALTEATFRRCGLIVACWSVG